MPVYRIEPTVKKEWMMEHMFQTEELSFWIHEKYRWGYITMEAKDEETLKLMIYYKPAKNIDGQDYLPSCEFEDWLDTDNDDLISSSIEKCENCNAEDIKAEFDAHNWNWEQICEKYGEPVETIKRMYCEPNIIKTDVDPPLSSDLT